MSLVISCSAWLYKHTPILKVIGQLFFELWCTEIERIVIWNWKKVSKTEKGKRRGALPAIMKRALRFMKLNKLYFLKPLKQVSPWEEYLPILFFVWVQIRHYLMKKKTIYKYIQNDHKTDTWIWRHRHSTAYQRKNINNNKSRSSKTQRS